MLLPLILIAIAFGTAAIAAYGTAAEWASRFGSSGQEFIYLSRRLQWPLFTVCFLCCVGLLLLVISGRRRVFWLIGLAPILALFAHRFATSPTRDFRVAESPVLIAADQLPEGSLRDEEWVIGLVVTGPTGSPEPQAYPYSALWRTPVIIQTTADLRFALLWNPFANFARAISIDRDINPRELEVVSMPVNALLVYNARYGEFINGVTGRKPDGSAPTGFTRDLPVQAMSWSRWRSIYPATKVLPPPSRSDELAFAAAVPVRPRYAIPPPSSTTRPSATLTPTSLDSSPIETPIIFLQSPTPHPPFALLPTDISDLPVNLGPPPSSPPDSPPGSPAGSPATPAVIFRESKWGRIRAFQRTLDTTELRFAPIPSFLKRPPNASMVDVASGSFWTETGRSLESTGPFLGRSLEPLSTFEGAYFEVLSYWIPNLKVHHVTSADFAEITPPPPPPQPPAPPAPPAAPPPPHPATPLANPPAPNQHSSSDTLRLIHHGGTETRRRFDKGSRN